MTRRPLIALLVSLCFALVGCKCNDDALAHLEQKQGEVQRDHQDAIGTWEAAELGASFHLGEAIQTGEQSQASLRLIDNAVLRLQPSTLVRFLDRPTPKGAAGIDLELGEATVEAADQPLRIETGFGAALIEARGRLQLTKTKKGTRFEVLVGQAFVYTKGGKRKLEPGHPAEVDSQGKLVADATERTGQAPVRESKKPDEAERDGSITLDVRGPGAQAKAPSSSTFNKLDAGPQKVEPGTTLKLEKAGAATVRKGSQSAELHGAGTFVIASPDGPLVSAASGGAIVASGDTDVVVKAPGGTIVAHPKSRVQLEVTRSNTTVSVHSGQATVTGEGQEKGETLQAGEQVDLGRNGKIKPRRTRGPKEVDLILAAGDSIVVHDPNPPTAFGITSNGECPGLYAVDVGRKGSVGEGQVNILVGGGVHQYKLRCVEGSTAGKVVASGKLYVARDAGTRKLPRKAPSTGIDTDGRRYTVLYQNLLPTLSVRWPNAPTGGPYDLRVTSRGGRSRNYSSGAPRYAFGSGMLGEGTHTLTFRNPKKSSKPTTLVIQFDNAAPKASISSPADRSFGRGGNVLVAGMALPGWVVAVAGKVLAQDPQNRFSSKVVAPTSQRALAIRFSHPQRGTHYYLRRSNN